MAEPDRLSAHDSQGDAGDDAGQGHEHADHPPGRGEREVRQRVLDRRIQRLGRQEQDDAGGHEGTAAS